MWFVTHSKGCRWLHAPGLFHGREPSAELGLPEPGSARPGSASSVVKLSTPPRYCSHSSASDDPRLPLNQTVAPTAGRLHCVNRLCWHEGDLTGLRPPPRFLKWKTPLFQVPLNLLQVHTMNRFQGMREVL